VTRVPGANLSAARREVLGDRALALHLGGMGYRGISEEIGVSKNTVGPLIRAALKRRGRDRDLDEELNRAIATKRQILEDLWNRMRLLPKKGTQNGFAHAKLAEEFRRHQLDLLFLSGVDLPDPERVILDALSAMNSAPVDLGAYLSQAEGVLGTPNYPEMPAEDDVDFFAIPWDEVE